MAEQDDLKIAIEQLTNKAVPYSKLWHYYDGNQPIVYSTERLKAVFGNINAKFTENWCAVVINAMLDKTNIAGVSEGGAAIWDASGLALDARTVHEEVYVTGESYVVAWPDETETMQAYRNDARMCHVEYMADNPRRKRFAAKWWTDEDGYQQLTLYYADHLSYYRSRSKVTGDGNVRSDDANAYMRVGEAANPFGQIPVFHFRTSQRGPKSELLDVVEPQDAINKLLADMMVAAEFGAFRQRWAITSADLSDLESNPAAHWVVPPSPDGEQGTSLGTFEPTDLQNYINAREDLRENIGTISSTPKHYFSGQGGTPSGEALIAMEAPLNAKVTARIRLFTHAWREALAFMAGVDVAEVEVNFDTPETVQPRTQAEIRQINVAAGVPLDTTLRREGWTEEELAQMHADQLRARRNDGTFGDLLIADEIGQRIATRVQQGNGQPPTWETEPA